MISQFHAERLHARWFLAGYHAFHAEIKEIHSWRIGGRLLAYQVQDHSPFSRVWAAHITCNKNTIPDDPQSPFVTSGIRLGTAAVSTRGFNTDDMDKVAEAIALIIDDHEANTEKATAIVKSLTDKYPLYE